VSPLNTVLNC